LVGYSIVNTSFFEGCKLTKDSDAVYAYKCPPKSHAL